MTENLINLLSEEKIFPIIRSKDPQNAIDIAKALIDGGIKVLEINVENPKIFKAIEEVSKYANVCAGGIITSMQADAAILSGAKILSSPIFSMNLLNFQKINVFRLLQELLLQMKHITLGKLVYRLLKFILLQQWAVQCMLKIY